MSRYFGVTEMELSIWTSTFDRVRFARMSAGLFIGTVALTSFFVGLALAAPKEEEEEEVEIHTLDLVQETDEEVEEELEPEPEEIEAVEDMVEQTGPRMASLKPPTEIPDQKPEEADVADTPGDGSGGPVPQGGLRGSGGPCSNKCIRKYKACMSSGGANCKAEGDACLKKCAEPRKPKGAEEPVAEAKPEPKVKAAPKRAGPTRVTPKMTPPKAISQPYPAHPEALKAQGIEGVVVMKYVIDVQGNVPAAKPVRGPMELAKVCWGAMKNWKFEPAKDEDGNPVSVTRIARFTFKIETN